MSASITAKGFNSRGEEVVFLDMPISMLAVLSLLGQPRGSYPRYPFTITVQLPSVPGFPGGFTWSERIEDAEDIDHL